METFSRISVLAVLALAVLASAASRAAESYGVAGTWRVYSVRLYYDGGGGGAADTSSTRSLELRSDGTWRSGSSTGKYRLLPIQAADWKRWGIKSYGPRHKLVLGHWNKGTADGPMEESGRVDFLWVIYHVTSPTVSAPGTVWLKYGRPRP